MPLPRTSLLSALALVAVAGLALPLAAQPAAPATAKPPTTPTTTTSPTATAPAPVKAAAAAVVTPNVDPAAPLPVDPRLVTGRLDNGLTYIVRQHATPPGRATIWMPISTGSLNETDRQRGVAHFLEHMAFNGSENFPPNSVIPYFESLGLTFGQHQNAFTSFDRTTYQLSLPNVQPETLDKGLTFFADVLTRLTLSPVEIDAERQIIVEEKTARSGAGLRVLEQSLERLMPGSRVAARLPIGTDASLAALAEGDFTAYYRTFYTPSNASIIVVADADPALVVEHIRKHFDAAPKAPAPLDLDSAVTPVTTARGAVITDKDLTRATVQIARVQAVRPPTRTVGDARRDMVEALASIAFNRRLSAKVNAGEVSFQGGGAGVSDLFRSATTASAQASGEPAKWREMLADLAREVSRARVHGFTQREIDDARRDILASLEQDAETEATVPGEAVAGRIENTLAEGTPLTSAAQTLDLARALLPAITASESSASFAAHFQPSAFAYLVQLPAGADAPTDAEVLKVGSEASAADVPAEAELAAATSLMDTLPTPGAVADLAIDEPSAVASAWLANGARLHHRFMDERKNDAAVSIILLGGALHETAANRGVTQAAVVAWQNAATSTLSSTQVRDLMTGAKVNVAATAGQDAIRLTVSGNPEQLETGLQLAHLLLTDPKLESAAFDRWKSRTLQGIAAQDKNPQQAVTKLIAETIFPEGEVRTKALTAPQVERLTTAEAQAWLDRLVATSPIEVAVVGDIPRERAMELVARYVGSLPSRDRVAPTLFKDLRAIKRPAGERRAARSIATATPMAIVVGGFYGADEAAVDDVLRLDLATRILTTRMIKSLREAENLVYSIGAFSSPANTFPGFGIFGAGAPTQPGKEETLAARLQEIYADFAKGGVTPEELDVAKKQAANDADEQLKQPGYWMSEIGELTYSGRSLADVLAAPAKVQATTADQVREAFAKYYAPENAMTIIIRPEAPAPTAAEPTAAEPATATPK